MSHEDGDVSMASARDDGFDMSVEHDNIDVFWHSTQQPALQSILEKSKPHSKKRAPVTWDANQVSAFTECLGAPTKSLFKEPSSRAVSMFGQNSASHVVQTPASSRPGMSRVTSSPDFFGQEFRSFGTGSTDLRKIRPSQRRTIMQQEGSPSGTGTSDYQGGRNTPGKLTDGLETLRERIDTLGNTWKQTASSPVSESEQQEPLRAVATRSDASSRKGARHHTTSDTSRPKAVTTIKVIKPHGANATASGSRAEGEGLMLPPAIPGHRVPSSNVAFPLQSPVRKEKNSAHMSVEEEREVPSPSSGRPFFPMSGPVEQSVKRAGSQVWCPNPQKSVDVDFGVNPGSSVPPSDTGAANIVSSEAQPKKVLGMRRTASGNRYEPTIKPVSHPPPLESVKQPTALARQSNSKPEFVVQSSLPTLPPSSMRISPELAAKPKSFKVPWADNAETESMGRIRPTAVDLSTDTGSSQVDISMANINPDASYSFDDIDAEELDRVLSQRGA